MTKCKICVSELTYFANARLLDKYDVSYYRCVNCHFIQTEAPFWLDEAYTEVINHSDIGLLSRNQKLASTSKVILSAFFDSNAKFLDYGGGYGIYVRLMRDLGFNFYWYDKFSDNLFAKPFEACEPATYEALTAFEVFEHLVDPLTEIEQMMQFSKNILLSTELVPESAPQPGEWWYYGLDHGQHVSLYSLKSLSFIAKKFGLNLYSNGASLHLITEKNIPGYWFRTLSRRKVVGMINMIYRKPSLLPEDYFKITGRPLK